MGDCRSRCPDQPTCVMLEKDGLELEEDLSEECKDAIKKMLTPKVERRISMNDVRTHPFVSADRFVKCDAADEGADAEGMNFSCDDANISKQMEDVFGSGLRN